MTNFKGANNPRWKGGIKIHAHGYRLIAVPNHPFKDKQGYVREHRLRIELSINRFLRPEEEVHHLDGNKQNNKLNNLVLCANKHEHLTKYHSTNGLKTRFKKGTVLNPKLGQNKNCVICNKLFYAQKSARPTKRFCSIKCKAISQTISQKGNYGQQI